MKNCTVFHAYVSTVRNACVSSHSCVTTHIVEYSVCSEFSVVDVNVVVDHYMMPWTRTV